MKYLRGQPKARVFIRGGFYSAQTEYDLVGQVSGTGSKLVSITKDDWHRMALTIAPNSFMTLVPHSTPNTRSFELAWASPEFESSAFKYGSIQADFGSQLERVVGMCPGGKVLMVLTLRYYLFSSSIACGSSRKRK
jgi:hypothetical protein